MGFIVVMVVCVHVDFTENRRMVTPDNVRKIVVVWIVPLASGYSGTCSTEQAERVLW
jgi:hypothetical protein